MPVHAASDSYALDRLVTSPIGLSDVVVVGRAAPRRPHRPRRRAPAVPHRHRHGLARPLGGRVTGLDFSPARSPSVATSRRGWASTSRSSRPSSTPRPTCSAPSASTSSTPASVRSAGCPTSALGGDGRRAAPARRPPLPARGPSGALGDRRDRAGPARAEVPVLRAAPSRRGSRRPTPTPTANRSRNPSATSGTTASARSSRPCWTPAWRSPASSSTTRSTGPRTPGWSRPAARHWRLPDGATPMPLEYTLEARKPG